MTVEEIKNGLDAAYKKAGHNAYFGNGFHAGVAFAEKKSKAPEMYEIMLDVKSALSDYHGDLAKVIKDKIEKILKEIEK